MNTGVWAGPKQKKNKVERLEPENGEFFQSLEAPFPAADVQVNQPLTLQWCTRTPPEN